MPKYKILMISTVYTGMKKFFEDGEKRIQGMPAFANTLKSFLAEGYEIHLILVSSSRINPPMVENLFTHECRRRSGRIGIALAALNTFKIGLQLARKNNFSLIYGHGEYGAIAGLLSLVLRIPNVRRIYGTSLYEELRPGGWWQRMKVAIRHPLRYLLFTLPTSGLIITNDGTRGEDVARLLGCSRDKINFWLNGVNKDLSPDVDKKSSHNVLDKHGIEQGVPLIVSTSRLEQWKRVDIAIRSLKYVMHRPRPLLIIIGDGSEMANLRSLAEEENVAEHTLFLGALDHEEVMALVSAADIFVSLYDVSNLGNCLIEAMALGKSIVSLDDGSLDGIITNGENGILAESFDPRIIAEKIDGLLQNTNLMNQLGTRARETACQIFETWDQRMLKEMRLIRNIIMS